MPDVTIVVAKIHGKPGQEDAIRKALRHVSQETLKEPGCVKFDAHQSLDTPTEFIVYEHWKDKQAVQIHMDMPYVQEFMGRVNEFFTSPIEVTFWTRF